MPRYVVIPGQPLTFFIRMGPVFKSIPDILLTGLLFKYPKGHNQFFFRMLLFTVENTANTVCKLPAGGSAPPKDRAAAAVASVGRRIWLIRYGTIKALRVYQRNIPYLPNTFRPAVIQYLQLRPFPKCPAQLI